MDVLLHNHSLVTRLGNLIWYTPAAYLWELLTTLETLEGQEYPGGAGDISWSDSATSETLRPWLWPRVCAQPCRHPDLRLPAPEPPNLWHFVTAAPTDWDSIWPARILTPTASSSQSRCQKWGSEYQFCLLPGSGSSNSNNNMREKSWAFNGLFWKLHQNVMYWYIWCNHCFSFLSWQVGISCRMRYCNSWKFCLFRIPLSMWVSKGYQVKLSNGYKVSVL